MRSSEVKGESAIQDRPFLEQLADGRGALGGRMIEGFKDMGKLLLAQRNGPFVRQQFGGHLVSIFENEITQGVSTQLGGPRDNRFAGWIDADAQPGFLGRGVWNGFSTLGLSSRPPCTRRTPTYVLWQSVHYGVKQNAH